MTSSLATERRDRGSALIRGIGAGVLARLVAIASPLLMVPLALGYMGSEVYALWTAALSLTAMAVFADLGLGQGLMTLLAPKIVAGDVRGAQRIVACSYSLLLGMACGGILALSLIPHFVSIPELLGFPGGRVQAAVVLLCLGAFFLNVPLSLIMRLQYAVQTVAAAHIWQATGSILALVFATLAVLADSGQVAVVAGALAGPLVANLGASAIFFKRRPELRPALVVPTGDEVRELLGLGIGFLALNVVMAVALNVDVLMVSHLGTATAVISFGLALRLFSQLGSLVSLVNAPLWPANAEALARGDWQWVSRVTQRMTLLSTLASALAGFVLVLAGGQLFEAWAGSDLEITRTLLVGAALYWTLVAALSPRFMVQNSVGVLLPQLSGWTSFLVVSVPLKFWVLSSATFQDLTLVSFAVALVTVLPGCLWGYSRTRARYSHTPENAKESAA